MSRMCAFRSVLASIVILVLLRAAPAYSWHGTGNITALAIDPVTPTTLYAGTSDRGVFKTTDGGATWSGTGLTNIAGWPLAIDPRTPTTLYAGTHSGLFKSTDGGASWLAINTGLPNPYVADLAIDPQTPATLYALVPDAGVFKSTDGGGTWNLVLRNEWFWDTTIFQDLAIDPQNPATLYASVYYATSETEFGEVLKSTDGGASWFCTALCGDWWSGPLYPPVGNLAIAPQTFQNPTTVYAAGSYGALFKSTDEGASWIELTICPDCLPVHLAIDPQNPATLYSVISYASYAGAFKSIDGGTSWSAVNNGLTDMILAFGLNPDVRTLAIDPVTPTTLYAGTNLGVFKSTDGGPSWSPTGLFQHSPLSSVSLNPASVTGGTASTGTVTLITTAPADGVVVTLSSSNTALATVPASVTVAAGATSASFAVSTNPVTVSTSVMISAAFDDATRSKQLTVNVPTTLSSVSLYPTSVLGGVSSTGYVSLTTAAPAGGAVVALSSSNPAVATVPASVTVAAGAWNANFPISTGAVSSSTTVTISGSYGEVAKSATLTVTAPTTLSSVSLSPSSVPGGTDSIGTVTLSAAAPADGAVVTLSSSNPAVAMIPASATVAAGAASASFRVYTAACASEVVTISGAYGGVTRAAGLTVTPATMDFVAIQAAEYFAHRQVLRVEGTSTGSIATLSVFESSSGKFIGTLTHYDGDKYRGQFTWPVNPQNITVRSSFCGSATKAVTSK